MTYKNGNTLVSIAENGTKIRYVPDNQTAMPEYPESIDLKITNKCMKNPPCLMCHEQSNEFGIHGPLWHPILNTLHPYTELAIGGGDPMTHPKLKEFLERMKRQKVICNITVHWSSFLENYRTLKQWTEESLIHGIGISINEVVPCEIVDKLIEFKNAVVHTIIGIADKPVYRQLMDRNLNVLLLGYKTFGRGIKYRIDNSADIAKNIDWVKQHINEFPEHFRTVSFDNLAIDQTEIINKIEPELFKQIYMGEDGSFTMYVDLVENKYAVSSTSERQSIDCDTIDQLFAKVRKKVGYATTK